MADTAPLMIWVTGADKGCTFVNKGWLAFTDRTLEQELGNGWTAGLHPDDLDHWLTHTLPLSTRAAVSRRNTAYGARMASTGGCLAAALRASDRKAISPVMSATVPISPI